MSNRCRLIDPSIDVKRLLSCLCTQIFPVFVQVFPCDRSWRNVDVFRFGNHALVSVQQLVHHPYRLISVHIGILNNRSGKKERISRIYQMHSNKQNAIEYIEAGDIGAAVMAVAAPGKHGVIRDLVGHGIGRELHEEPQVPNVGRAGSGHVLKAGMVLAIEPMIAVGTDRIRTLADRWTVVTADGSLSAHFEHTVAVTAEGPRLLTGGGIWEDTPSSTGTPVGSSA